MGGLAQAVDVVDGEEGVLVDGVAVIAVADDEGVDAVELGNEHLQNAERVHGAQGMGGVGAEQDFAQRVPEIGPFGNVDGEDGQRVGDAVFGGLRERVAVRGHQREDAQDGGGVVELRAGLNVDAALVEEEIGAGDGRAAAAELAVEADRRGQMLHEQRGAAIDDARVPVVGAHPVGGIGGAAGFQADGARGGLVLRLPVEGVVVAAVAEVEKTSGGGEEVEGGFGVAAGALEDAAALARPLLGLLQVEEEGEPDGEVVVAQAAGTILQVGFEMKDGVAEFGVAGAGDLAELLRDGVPLAEDEAGKGDLVELLVERKLAGEEAAVESGEGEFEIVGVEAAGFLDGARAGAGAQADVPHALDDGADGFAWTVPRFCRRRRRRGHRCRSRGRDLCGRSRPGRAGQTFCAGRPAKARRHISMRMRSTTAERRRMAAVPSPVRSQVWRTSAISLRYCSRRSSTAKTTGFMRIVLRGLPKQEGIVTRISDKCRKGEN